MLPTREIKVLPHGDTDKRIPLGYHAHYPVAWVDNDDVGPGEGEELARLFAAAQTMYEVLRGLLDSGQRITHANRTAIESALAMVEGK